jgi:hypothetical protein
MAALFSVFPMRSLLAGINYAQATQNTLAGIIPFSGQTITHFKIREEQGIPDTHAGARLRLVSAI